MVEGPNTNNLLQATMRLFRLPWGWTTAIFASVLILILLLGAYLDGSFNRLSEWLFWRGLLTSPVLIIYILIMYPFMWRLWERALKAFQPLLSNMEDTSDQLVTKAPTPKRRWELTAVSIGMGFVLILSQPWSWEWDPGEFWLNIYQIITFLLLFGLLSWLFYSGIASSRYLARLSRQKLKLDIFEPGLLSPVAIWSLGTSFAFIGGISLSLVFQTRESLLTWHNIIIYGVLVGATVLLFFLSMWSTHKAMVEAKNRELALARKHLSAAYRELKEQGTQERPGGTVKLYSTLTAWAAYERQGKEAPTWPFNAGIIRRLVVSVLIPGFVYLIRFLLGQRIGT